jgi:hypothetical protein
MTFGQELIVLHRTPPMFGNSWCMLGNSVKFFNKEHSLLVQTQYGMPRGAKMSSALTEPQNVAHHSD